ncbi:Rz1-like lysis system protein LysC [Caballeronia sp. LZ032]|uniref:Rz1-like lysis system protein LysC n=1 Tax=Caballeronia sp. LZ032 TaxID=3038565 RepID=UPI002856ECAC|nr:Rz1-like lysis system protein LysC [Caballeronia sp. LZ032]MDR5883608.1 Rz1-like lysis system protein LysC [Caballeronia sp. LZ032]
MCACQQAPLSPAPRISVLQCQTITRCTLPAMAPTTNGELRAALTTAKGAWGACAAKVDMIVSCQTAAQAEIDAQTAKGKHD